MVVIGVVDVDEKAVKIIREDLSGKGFAVNVVSGDTTQPLHSYAANLSSQYLIVYMNRGYIDFAYDVLLVNCLPKGFLLPEHPRFCAAVVNSDNCPGLPLRNADGKVVWYGLSSKSDITASSIESEFDYLKFTCCVQDELHAICGKRAEICEIPVEVSGVKTPISAGLGALSVLLLCGVEIGGHEKILL